MKPSILTPYITLIAALVLVAAHTQLTVRQVGLRLAGIREGAVQKVLSLESYVETTSRFDTSRLQIPTRSFTNQIAVLKDGDATFIDGELKGKQVFIADSSFEVLGNTATHILVRCDDISHIDSLLAVTTHYQTGYSRKTGIVKLVLSVPSVNLTLSDLLLALLAILIGVKSLKERHPIKSHTAILTAVPFILIGAVSLVPALRILDGSYMEPEIKNGLVELIQFVEVLAIGFWCFVRIFSAKDNQRRFPALIILMASLVVIIGLIEYIAVFSGWTLRGLLDVEAIDSIFGIRYNSPRAWTVGSESNRNILALYLAITFPFFLFGIKTAPKRWQRVVAGCLAGCSLILIMHAWLLATTVIVGGILVYSWRSLKGMVVYCIAVTAVFGVLFGINGHHGRVLVDSIAYHRTIDTYGLQPMPLKGTDFNGNNAWQQKYLERQAAWNAVSFSPLFGLGIGNYQTAINSFYENSKVEGHAIVKQPVNLMERNSHSLFLVSLVETGILGVICLAIYLLLPALTLSKSVIKQPALTPPLAAALLASAAIIFITSFQMSFMVRGLQIIVIAILGCCYAMACKGTGADSTVTGEG